MTNALLIAGGVEDPQLAHLAHRAEKLGRTVVRAFMDAPAGAPSLHWRLDDVGDDFSFDGDPTQIAAAFIRQDVFKYLRTQRSIDRSDARAWKILLDGWLWSRPGIQIFNRGFLMRDEVNKPLALAWARECGLRIPRTEIHGLVEPAAAMLSREAVAYKPIGGGDLCRALDEEALGRVGSDLMPRPYIFQQKLISPEVRVFRVKDQFFAFDVASEELDYRDETKKGPKLTQIAPPAHLLAPLKALTDRLGLDYSAADFKTCAETGELCFLEANSNPMFMAFDKASNGALATAMVEVLTPSEPNAA